MEVKFNAGDSVRIPKGCKAIVKDDVVIFEPKECNFKKGDVIVSLNGEILLVDECTNDALSSCVNIDEEGKFYSTPYKEWNRHHEWRLTSEEGKQKLFAKMKEQRLRWNAEAKRVEKIRWKAEDGEEYCYVGNQGFIMVDKEDGHCADKNRHEFGNYFRTEEQTEEAKKRVKETLRKYHEEIGE